MKLYFMCNGRVILPPDHYLGIRKGAGYSIPVIMALLVHPTHGPVALDTGGNHARMEPFAQDDFKTDDNQRIDRYLEKLGYLTDAVKHVCISHMHLDHGGNVDLFSKAEIHIRKTEWESALALASGGYMPKDIEVCRNAGLNLDLIPDGEDYDVFGDGSLVCIDTHGHTAGHQSFIIDLPNTGKVVIAMDCTQLEEDIYGEDFLRNENADPEGCLAAAKRIRKLWETGAFVVCGHDPDQWETMRRFPEYYD